MSKAESIFVWLIIGPVIPVVLFLTGWWTSLIFVTDRTVFVFGLLGLGIGCLIDFIFVRQWISKVYTCRPIILAVVYVFYSICVFGFFMGVPIFNITIGIIAGVFMGRKFYHLGMAKEQLNGSILKVSIFSASIMGLISVASAYFATKDITDTALNLRGMFKLPFLPTAEMIIALIIFGGLGLITVQYWLTKRCILWSNQLGIRIS